ncbi:terminase small subunit [Enterococcus dongliensis]|uniref:Terminase small subunit n=1 Tax=Enterococcus dongliensis TaxID=2559925 RepID=A0AAW8TLF7_9ENTE|nr:terminase small subunit [Enterococcus dongliensis]MDT2635686.1 terminase small subunit [Enterococcus dongliensis]MDT2637658.1 terminase small subunit [Enterococcus dongliensis]MDT2642722.1 terminase small subunit [Enterococcus dongliensis]
MSVRGPTRQQKEFVDIYLKKRKKNATQAAMDAGYSPKSASSQAYQLLQNPIVQEYLEKREKQLEKELKREFFFDAIDAREVLSKIVNNPEAKDVDRINAAKDLLDRAGYKAVDVHEIQSTVNINADGLTDSELEDRIAELERELGTASDEDG